MSLGAVLLLAWQCLAPSHWHVLFNNVGIFYCFAFITAREAKTENRNRKPDALKAELYRPTTVRCNMSIWIQKGGFLTGCLLNSAAFSAFPLLSEFSFLYFSAFKRLYLYLWPPIDHPGSAGSADLGRKRSQSLKPQGSISMVGMKSTPRMWESSGNGKGWGGGNVFLLPYSWARVRPDILKKTTMFETSPPDIIMSIMDDVKAFSPA